VAVDWHELIEPQNALCSHPLPT